VPLVFLLAAPSGAFAFTTYSGTVAMLEVWANGNVAFTLNASVPTCNGQFVINASLAQAAKNIYAAVLAAKKTGTPIRVITSACGTADNYGGNYNLPDFVYAD
jgi:phosphoglycerate-specific signal transduction histidine kinase